MEESFKSRIILILVILTAIFFISAASSCSHAKRLKVARDKEMLTRLELEEKMSKSVQERQVFENKLNTLAEDLAQEKTSYEVANNALAQEQLSNKGLKEELLKVTKLKEKLEEDLKEALVAVKPRQSKK